MPEKRGVAPIPVPTCAELLEMGLATATYNEDGSVSRYHPSAEGHALMGAAMRWNGRHADLPDPWDKIREERRSDAPRQKTSRKSDKKAAAS